MAAFDLIDQSVPAPEFGVGVVFRFTFSDLRKLEMHARQSLASVSDTIREVMPEWSWISFMLSKKDMEFSLRVFDLALKKDDKPFVVDWENPPMFSFIEACAKAEIAMLASLHGMTIEEARKKAEEVRDKPMDPLGAGEDTSTQSGEQESAPA
jgi:hypothetical protein